MKKTIYTKQYYENFALNVLKKYYPKKFFEFEKHECPDWLCGNIGLEITRAVSTQDGELDAFIKDCFGKEFSAINIEWLNKLGFETELTKSNMDHIYECRSKENGVLGFLHTKDGRYIFLWFISRMATFDDCAKLIINAAEKKLKKLNSNYDRLEENDLAIIVQEQLNCKIANDIIVDDIINKIINGIKLLYSDTKYSSVFDRIFIIFFDNLFTIDAKNFGCKRIQISSNDLLLLSQQSVV